MSAIIRGAARWSAAGIGLAVGAYAGYVGAAWLRYGQPPRQAGPEYHDELLDRFIPVYEAGAHHHVRISAPAEITFAAAREMDLFRSPVVRAIIRARELVLGATPDERRPPQALLEEMLALGWGVLAKVPGREVVVGAVTQPWKANVVFRSVLPDEFATFDEPGFVKIAWTLRADPFGAAESVFRTETRVVSTDPAARARFRWYWSFFSPGMMLIRWVSLAPLKRETERRARKGNRSSS